MAERIENQIVRSNWPVGEVVASESELLAQFKVSRAVLREAIRIVENHRVARMRRGPNGGLVVTQPDARSLTRAAALLLDYEHVTGANLANARITIELAAVEDATKQLDERKVDILKAALEVESSERDASAALRIHDIHTIIASLSGNPALRLFVDVLVSLTAGGHGQLEMPPAEQTDAYLAEVADNIHQAHTKIVEAMISGDVSLAVHRMRRHLVAMEAWLH